MNKGSIVERLCSDLDRKEPRYKSPTLLLQTVEFSVKIFVPPPAAKGTFFRELVAQNLIIFIQIQYEFITKVFINPPPLCYLAHKSTNKPIKLENP